MGRPRDKLGRGVYQLSGIARQLARSTGRYAARRKNSMMGRAAGAISSVAKRVHKIARRFR